MQKIEADQKMPVLKYLPYMLKKIINDKTYKDMKYMIPVKDLKQLVNILIVDALRNVSLTVGREYCGKNILSPNCMFSAPESTCS